jgi:aminomethyltransferase
MAFEEVTKKTPLFSSHEEWGARMVNFAGWMMPVQYEGIIVEHHYVRKGAGLFDISHMGEFFVSGSKACEWLNRLLTNDVSKLALNQGQYTILTNDQGGVIDDLITYRIGEDKYFLVVNASKIDEDAAWMGQHREEGLSFEDRSDSMAAVALQGPRAEEVLFAAFPEITVPRRNYIVVHPWQDTTVFIARTGYTGEDGFEIFFPVNVARKVWELLLNKGQPSGCVPCGLGARDTLRLEACLPLNGNDLGPTISPIEAGLGKFVSFTKTASFPGRSVLEKQKEQGAPRQLVAFSVEEKGAPPPRAHYVIYNAEKDGSKIGEATSGGLSPTFQKGIGLALIDSAHAAIGSTIYLDIRGKRVPAIIQPKPIYKRS